MNDFVNPQHRGVNLPAGYKDLMDVLESKKKPQASEIRHSSGLKDSGGLADVEKYLRAFLKNHSPFQFLTKHGGISFCLARSEKGPSAVCALIVLDPMVEKSVREIFAKAGIDLVSKTFGTPAGNTGSIIECSLPSELPDLLRIVTTLLKEAYGVSDRAGLCFISPGTCAGL